MFYKKKLKKITVVAHALSAGGGVSVGRNFIKAVQKKYPSVEFQFFVPGGLDYESCIHPELLSEIHTYNKKGYLNRIFYDAVYLERNVARFSPDLVLCLGNRATKYSLGVQILLCHDPHLFYEEKFFERELIGKKIVKKLQKYRLRSDLSRIDMLLVQTKVAAKRIQEMYGYSGAYTVIPNAVSVDVVSEDEFKAPKVLLVRDKKFKVFCLTRYYPHKNLEIFLEVFEKFKDRMRDVVVFITIDAFQHKLAKQLLESIREKGLNENIINVGPLSQGELGCYYEFSDAFILPTTLESFSGTYLEAMKFSCPILTSDLDFANDVCGDAALYFSPWSSDSICEAIEKVKMDSSIKLELVRRGRKRLKESFRTWEENAELLASKIDQLFL